MSFQKTTPYNERVLKIQDKLTNIQAGTEHERFSKIESAENRLKDLEDNFMEFQEITSKKLNGLKENVVKMHRIIEEDRQARENSFYTKTRELASFENKFATNLENQISTRKDVEQRFLRSTDEKVNLVRSEIYRETKNRVESIDNISTCFRSDVQKLNDEIKIQTQERQEIDQSIMKKLTEELIKTNSSLQTEKKIREDSESAVFEMLRDVVNKIKTEIDNERKQREASEEVILNLLEDTCNKLNAVTSV